MNYRPRLHIMGHFRDDPFQEGRLIVEKEKLNQKVALSIRMNVKNTRWVHFNLYLHTYNIVKHYLIFTAFYYSIQKQEAQLMLINHRDAFKGQSRSPNIVPFDMLGRFPISVL